jgi:co-chaperonin GroES (HSP10)
MQLLHDWLLVRMEPIQEKVGSLFTVHGERVRKGEVLAVGPGKARADGVRIPMGVEVGEVVVFYREHLEHQQGKQLVSTLKELGDDLGLIRVTDVLFVIPPGSKVTVST